MSNIRIQLLNIINREDYNSMNFIIAKYLLENLERKKTISTKELAQECNVSKSSISRFCRKLGYEDFLELQIAIGSYHSFGDERFSNLKGDSTGELIQSYFQCIQNTIDRRGQFFDTEALEALVRDIHDYERVVVMGHVQSAFPAVSLQHYLTILHKFVYCTQDISEEKEMLETFDERGLIIIFSAGGKFIERVLDGMGVMKRKHLPKIYMITCSRTKHLPFVSKYIELMESYNYTSPVFLEMYSNLISLVYRRMYTDTDE